MLKELTDIVTIGKYLNFFNIYYSRKDGSCSLNIGIFEQNFVEQFEKKVRKKSWPFFERLLLHVLGTSDPKSEYHTTSEVPGCARFQAYTRMYVKLLHQLKKFWSFQTKVMDFNRFFAHANLIPEYFNLARTYVSVPATSNTQMPQPSVPVPVQSNQTPPWVQAPATQSVVPMGTYAQPQVAPMGMPVQSNVAPMGGYVMPQPMMTAPMQTMAPVGGYVPQPMMQQPMLPMGMPQSSGMGIVPQNIAPIKSYGLMQGVSLMGTQPGTGIQGVAAKASPFL